MPTFTYVPDFGAELKEVPRVRAVKFGEGYEQRSAEGINAITEIWSVSFNTRTNTERDDIRTFLRARAAVEAFDWTSPMGTVGKWVCRDWATTMRAAGVNDMSFTFEQVFEA